MPGPDDDGLDPAAFLKSVRELSEKREREDEARYRKLEEEVEKSRAARAARRAERARSISPHKKTPPSTSSRQQQQQQKSPRPAALPKAGARQLHAELGSPSVSTGPNPMASETSQQRPASPTKHIPEFAGFGSVRNSASSTTSSAAAAQAKSLSPAPSDDPSRSVTSLARSGTLSWQQRPTSTSSPVARPSSVTQPRESREHAREPSTERAELSRDQIAASLGARDPTWFRQTPDRGTGNAAFRRSKEDQFGTDNLFSGKRGLPGLSREPSNRSRSPVGSESFRSESSRPSSVRDSTFTTQRFSSSSTSASTPNRTDLSALVAADELQQQASPMSDKTSSTDVETWTLARTPTMSSAQARLGNSGERPVSPTKGMGGFVQSAMMKRSDSVNKRWSAQPGASSVSRQNSATKSSSGASNLQGSHSMPRLEPTTLDSNTELPPSTTSSSNELPSLQSARVTDSTTKSATHSHSRTRSVLSNHDDSVHSPPTSPGKRWSPTKSSWIESALTKSETPRPMSPAKNSQPSWMADIARAKAQRASVDLSAQTGTPQNLPEPNASRPASPLKSPLLARGTTTDPRPDPFSTPMKPVDDSASLVEKMQSTKLTPKSPRPESIAAIPSKESSPIKTPSAVPTLDRTGSNAGGGSGTQPRRQLSSAKAKPPTPPKSAVTDLRSNLKSRASTERKQDDTPEFLSKFGKLRKTATERYVAPDVLKENITKGKAELAKTDGPVKTVRRDEFKESLLAKKDDWKKAKDEGRDLPGEAYQRKAPAPAAPSKAEALAKRDMLARSESVKTDAASEQRGAREGTPEALTLQRSMGAKSISAKDRPKLEATGLEKRSEAEATPAIQTEKSKLAARFNPGLAGILARGPPSANSSNPPSRVTSPSTVRDEAPRVAPQDDGPLQDMRKGRAKGPKRRKQGAAPEEKVVLAETDDPNLNAVGEPAALKPKPRAPPGSAASLMMASLSDDSRPTSSQEPESAPATRENGPRTPLKLTKSPVAGAGASAMWASLGAKPKPAPKSAALDESKPRNTSDESLETKVPEFSGFTSKRDFRASEDKENSQEPLSSVKSAASTWGRPSGSEKAERPPQIQLPSKKDEEAAMRSAGLLACSPARNTPVKSESDETSEELGSAPPKPAKSSRVVSGQLHEASPNKGVLQIESKQETAAEKLLTEAFGSIPQSAQQLSIDVEAMIASAQAEQPSHDGSGRKTVLQVGYDGNTRSLPPQEEYTFFDQSVYVCQYASTGGSPASRKSQIYTWTGQAASNAAETSAQVAAKKLARVSATSAIQHQRQGLEPTSLLHALGGILVTRRGARENASKQYMLCGRKHLGHITFDEVDFGVDSLCPGFVYLISYPVTLQQTKLYLWKGSACSSEEISGARLAAMDLSETGEIIEVDDGAEFSSFLRVFGDDTTKASIPKALAFWQSKALAPSSFDVRLFRIQQPEVKLNIISSLWNRRPSWNSLSPSRTSSPSLPEEVKVEAKLIQPFTQESLEAEGVYLLDAHSEVYIIIGPLFGSQAEPARATILGQAVLCAITYAALASRAESRPATPKSIALLGGRPDHLSMLFRHWDEGRGFWGTSELMSGARSSELKCVSAEEMLAALHKA